MVCFEKGFGVEFVKPVALRPVKRAKPNCVRHSKLLGQTLYIILKIIVKWVITVFGKYKVAHLLGSTKDHEKQFRLVETELTKMGYICFAPVVYDFSVYTQHADLLNDMCYEKLLVCDICVVVSPDFIGKSTINRIEQAAKLGKPVYVWENNRMRLLQSSS